jgi:hypothetical protein
MSNLAPGDLCEIVRMETCAPEDDAMRVYGKIVVLLRIAENRPSFWPGWAPYWECAGVGDGLAPLEMEPREEESVV